MSSGLDFSTMATHPGQHDVNIGIGMGGGGCAAAAAAAAASGLPAPATSASRARLAASRCAVRRSSSSVPSSMMVRSAPNSVSNT
jgi:hypothetical protein